MKFSSSYPRETVLLDRRKLWWPMGLVDKGEKLRCYREIEQCIGQGTNMILPRDVSSTDSLVSGSNVDSASVQPPVKASRDSIAFLSVSLRILLRSLDADWLGSAIYLHLLILSRSCPLN